MPCGTSSWVGLQCVNVIFPDHTHFLFDRWLINIYMRSEVKSTFYGFPWVHVVHVTSTAGRAYDFLCLLIDGSTRSFTETGFMERPGIKPAKFWSEDSCVVN